MLELLRLPEHINLSPLTSEGLNYWVPAGIFLGAGVSYILANRGITLKNAAFFAVALTVSIATMPDPSGFLIGAGIVFGASMKAIGPPL